jgi:predicted dehydrogenase
MQPLNIAVIGAGLLGSRHARVFYEQPGCKLAAVVDVNLPRAQEIAQKWGSNAYASLDEALQQQTLDAVSIATPDHLHHDLAIAAMRAGKPVLIEKPLATTEAEAYAITQTSTERSVLAMVNYSQRFVSDHAWIKQRIAGGEIGRVQMILSVKFDTLSVPTGMIRGWANKTSPIFFMSSHDLDLAVWFLEAAPTEVVAHETRGTLQGMGIDAHDGLNALIQFEGGISANFHASWVHPNTYPKVADGFMQIIGSAGAITYNNRTRTAEMFNASGGQTITFSGPHTADEVDGKITGAFVSSIRHFLDCVRSGCEPDTSPQRTLRTTLAQTAIIESLRRHTPIKL